MPSASIFLPRSSPTAFAAATLPPLASSRDLVEVAQSVRPASSSMSCSQTCRSVRWTETRGRSAVPRTRLTGAVRAGQTALRQELLQLHGLLLPAHEGLAGLQDDDLTDVADALALVGLGRALAAQLGGELADAAACRGP